MIEIGIFLFLAMGGLNSLSLNSVSARAEVGKSYAFGEEDRVGSLSSIILKTYPDSYRLASVGGEIKRGEEDPDSSNGGYNVGQFSVLDGQPFRKERPFHSFEEEPYDSYTESFFSYLMGILFSILGCTLLFTSLYTAIYGFFFFVPVFVAGAASIVFGIELIFHGI